LDRKNNSQWAVNAIKKGVGMSANFTVGDGGMIMKSGFDTGYVISGGSIRKDSDKGYSIDWMFN